MKKLNKSQQKILDYLRERSQDGVPPSVREICAATGLKSTSTVHAHLKALEENGFISRDAGLNRAIHISGVERSVQVPVLGRVTAGLPIWRWRMWKAIFPSMRASAAAGSCLPCG